MLEKHDLVHELPEYREQIHELKLSDSRFLRLFKDYHDVEHEVHRIEAGVEAASDEYLDSRKKVRLDLKDRLLAMLKSATVEV